MSVTEDRAHRWLHGALGLDDGQTPFFWQAELLERFLEDRAVRSLDIPTGLGKTAVIAIWLVARACGARLPRRLVYVVDRRAVVDQSTTVAEGLRAYVDRTPDLKNALGLEDRSLPISTLRGQHVDNREWLEDPSSPAIIVGTVDMIGSRLLFEGYAARRKMRSYYAGLLGVDALAVLDEAHLVPPFEKLLRAIAEGSAEFGPRRPQDREVLPSFRLLSLSATSRACGEDCLGLKPGDRSHEVEARRLAAPKRLIVERLGNDEPLEDALARQAWKLADNGMSPVRCIVFCNSRRVAAAAKEALQRLASADNKAKHAAIEVETDLFVGGRRVFERVRAAKRLQAMGFIAGSNVERTRPAFVFATAAGEVGVDLDADHMVSDLVEWERMVQRVGRVNRRGEGIATVLVIAEPTPEPSKSTAEALNKHPDKRTKKQAAAVAAYEASVEAARARLEVVEHLRRQDGAADASPAGVLELRERAAADPRLDAILEAATTPAPLRPALSRPLVDAWSMTSLEEHTGRPEIDPWLRGWVEHDPPQTSVVWRSRMPTRSGGVVRKKEVEDFFEAAPPHASEVLEIETHEVVRWLTARAGVIGASVGAGAAISGENGNGVEGARLHENDVVAIILSSAGGLRETLRLEDLESLKSRYDEQAAKAKAADRPFEHSLHGATLVLDARLAGLTDGLLDPTSDEIPDTADGDGPWLSYLSSRGDEPGPIPAVRFRVRRCDAVDEPMVDSHWRERMRFATDVSEEGEPLSWLIIDKWRHDAATEEDRSAGRPQLLDDHLACAERHARDLGTRLGLPRAYAETLAIAARLHDAGKAATRWQRAFNAGADGIYAKTRGPINQALLDRYRHEFGSLPIAESDPALRGLDDDHRDLALHLIAAHHGFARPLVATSGCEDGPPSMLEGRARQVALRFVRLQRRWGPWGLAWWEALLRAADGRASAENDAADSSPTEERD